MVWGKGYCVALGATTADFNGRPIDRKTFEEAMKERAKSSAGGEDPADRQKAEDAVLNELITRMLMLDEAGKRGITVTDAEVNSEIEGIRKSMGDAAFAETLKEKGITTDGFRKQTREKMLMSRFTEGLLGNESVADEAVRRYYSESPRPFLRPVKVLMNMIEFDSEEAAAAAMREIREKKVDFDDLALRAGNENRAHASGYGWANPDLFSPGLSADIRNLRPGQSGGPYKGRQKFYLVKVKDREKEAVASFDEVKDSIKNRLLEEKRQMAFAHWLAWKRNNSQITVNLR